MNMCMFGFYFVKMGHTLLPNVEPISLISMTGRVLGVDLTVSRATTRYCLVQKKQHNALGRVIDEYLGTTLLFVSYPSHMYNHLTT